MNVHITSEIASPRSVTTGPFPAATKVYAPALDRDDVLVPQREMTLSPSAGKPPVLVYDSSGPYIDAAAEIDLAAGMPEIRQPWLVRRPGVVAASPRASKPEDNGSVPADKLVPICTGGPFFQKTLSFRAV